MRKHVSLPLAAAAFFILVFQNAMSQNSSPYWSLAGNNNASAASKLGTTNATPLRLFTNNQERLRIDPSGNVGVGIASPIGKFSIRGSGGTPAGSWVTAGSPIFTGFGEAVVGNGDFILSLASNTPNARGVLLLRKARGTLSSPAAVGNNDYLGSLLGSGYDGNAFQNPATIDFYVDGAPSSGNVPARISFVTGSNSGNRTERMVVKSNGYVGIGTNAPSNELHVIGRGRFSNGLSVEEAGIYSSCSYCNGVEGYGNTTYGAGVFGSGYYGVYGSGILNGVYGSIPGGFDQSGVYGYSAGYGIGTTGYCVNGSGVYGYSENYVGVWGETSNSSSYAGYFVGNVYTTGSYLPSAKKLKQNITDLSSAMSIIAQLQPKEYEYRHDGKYKQMNLPIGKRYGLVAEDLEQVLPSLVKDTKAELHTKAAPAQKPGVATAKPTAPQAPETIDFKAVNYTELIPIMIKGMQEQQQENEELKARLAKLEDLVNKLTNGRNLNTVVGAGTLSQATPNPSKGTTRISYSLTSGTGRAQLLLTDAAGKTVKAVSLNASNGVVDLNTASLPGGIYNYSLMVDGKIAETKKLTVIR